jgi:hypothetical protein
MKTAPLVTTCLQNYTSSLLLFWEGFVVASALDPPR